MVTRNYYAKDYVFSEEQQFQADEALRKAGGEINKIGDTYLRDVASSLDTTRRRAAHKKKPAQLDLTKKQAARAWQEYSEKSGPSIAWQEYSEKSGPSTAWQEYSEKSGPSTPTNYEAPRSDPGQEPDPDYSHISRKRTLEQGGYAAQLAETEAWETGQQNEAEATAKIIARQQAIRAEKLATGVITMEYTPKQKAQHSQLGEQMQDIDDSRKMSNKEKLTKKAELLTLQNAIVPQDRLNNKPPHKKGQGPGDSWQVGTRMMTRDKDGVEKVSFEIKQEDIRKYRTDAFEFATTKDTGTKNTGTGAGPVTPLDLENPQPISKSTPQTSTDWKVFGRFMLADFKAMAITSGMDFDEALNPSSGMDGWQDILLTYVPKDQREAVAEELGFETDKMREAREAKETKKSEGVFTDAVFSDQDKADIRTARQQYGAAVDGYKDEQILESLHNLKNKSDIKK